jgi:hypothetical protein
MTDGVQFKYEVAFSCLAQDEELAANIEARVRDRLSTFIYTERQKEIAGRDGEMLFREVFGTQARTVVVLYRDGWGTTPWTRIEEAAIRDRGFSEGYDFLTVIPLDSPPKPPKWLPKNRIWLDIKRLGVEGAVAVIEERVRELAGVVARETPAERAARMSREQAEEAQKAALLHGERGVSMARTEMDRLVEILREGTSRVSAQMPFEFTVMKQGGVPVCIVSGFGVSLSVGQEIPYRNSLDDSFLGVVLWRGRAPFGLQVMLPEPKRLKGSKFQFDIGPGAEPGWRESGGAGRFLTTSLLEEDCLKMLLDGVESERRGNS